MNLGYVPKPKTNYIKPYSTIFFCPSAKADGTCYWGGDTCDWYATAYGMNLCVCGYKTWNPDIWHCLKYSQIKKPSTNIWVVDVNDWYYTHYYGTGHGGYLIVGRHSEGANILFCDGHCAWVKYDKIPHGVGISTEDFLKWWGPHPGGY